MPRGIYPRKTDVKKTLPPLPEGIRLGERPVGIDFMVRGNERWVTVINYLKELHATATIQIDVTGCTKSKVNGMKSGIKHAGDKLGFKNKIKFATQGSILHVWTN